MNRAGIEALIPHAGGMCLLEDVASWDETTVVCRAVSHRLTAHPMARDGILPALAGIEYAAQAMAVHGGLSGAAGRPRRGFLASLRDVECRVARLDDIAADLTIKAEKLMGEETRVIYGFTIDAGDAVLLTGRAAVVLDA